jgi:hypothetical protein
LSQIVAKNIEGKIKAAASQMTDDPKNKIVGQTRQGEAITAYLCTRGNSQGLNYQK